MVPSGVGKARKLALVSAAGMRPLPCSAARVEVAAVGRLKQAIDAVEKFLLGARLTRMAAEKAPAVQR